MKSMNRRPSTVLSRALLAVFLTGMPGGHEAFAAVVRAAAVPASIGGIGSLGSLGALGAAPGLSPALSPAVLAATPLTVPVTPAPVRPTPTTPPAAKLVLTDAALQAASFSAPNVGGAASKSAAGTAFDGAVSGRLAAASEDVDPSEPSSRQVDAMRAALASFVKPGEAVDRVMIHKLALAASVPVAKAETVLREFAEDGHLVKMPDGVYVYSEARARQSQDAAGPMLKKANDKTLEGIELFHAGDLRSYARALASFGEALRLLAAAGAPAATRVETAILYKNAALELTRTALTRYDGILEQNAHDENNVIARENVARVQKSLAGRYFALNAAKPTLADRDQEWLAQLIGKLKFSKDGSHKEAFGAGWSLLNSFHNGEPLPDDGIKPLSEMEGGRFLTRQGFSLISKTDEKYASLNQYGSNVTRAAVEGKLTPMIGRKAEMRQIVKTLLRVEKNNPLIIGEKGVGKTAIANGLAQMIVDGEIPELAGVNIIKLDLTKVVAGTKYRGEFEERMVKILDEARASNGKVRLFIDEIHMLMGAGSASGSQDAANILKEALADGSISVIGATTMEEYRKIEKDGALARRFNPVKLLPPTKEEAEQIVDGVKARYESKHKVTVGPETVKAVVALASRYITDRNLPDSALDLLDDAGAEVELKASEAAKAGNKNARRAVLPEDIAQEVALRTGIPAGKVGAAEKDQLQSLPAELNAKVIGQAEAVAKVAKGVQRGRMGLRNVKQPIGTFMLLGPTGVGKTELAKQTAKTVFGSEKNMIRLDMSEYQEAHSVSRMIGSPPGYVGHDEAGQLTEAVRRNPYSVILLDEIEKADVKVLDVLLQIIDDGRLTDGQGRTVDFTNTIIMMTSNLGGSLAGAEDVEAPAMGFEVGDSAPKAAAPSSDRRGRYLAALKAKLRPEFLNRVGEDGIVVFNELGRAELQGILALRVRELEIQLGEHGISLTLSAAAKDEILVRAEAQKAYGGRPLKQIVERDVTDAIVAAQLQGRVGEGDKVVVDWNAAKGTFTADKAQ